MGVIADDMISGLSCSWCGVYFETEHQYPVACHSCFDDLMKSHPEEFEETLEGSKGEKIKLYVHRDSGIQRAI
jgi:hypothetical protein